MLHNLVSDIRYSILKNGFNWLKVASRSRNFGLSSALLDDIYSVQESPTPSITSLSKLEHKPIEILSFDQLETIEECSDTNSPDLRPAWDRGGKTKTNSLTPLLSSMRKLIDENKGCVCLIQVGSFYELYFEQASIIGPKLGIKVATRRVSNYTVPMAGFPVTQLQKFVKILVHDLSVNVAIIDQFDNIRTDTDLKHRKISRIVSPGTLVDETFMNYSKNNYLVALSPGQKPTLPLDVDTIIGLSWVDISLGELYVQQTTLAELPGDLRRISPSEVILPKDFLPCEDATSELVEMADLKSYFVRYHKTTYRDYKQQFQKDVLSTRKLLEDLSVREEAALNLVLSYVNVNLPERKLRLEAPMRYINTNYLCMDSRTRDALDLTGRSTFGSISVSGTLLNTIKRTVTPSGSRLLNQWVKSPTLNEAHLKERLDFVSLFKSNPIFRLQLSNELAQVGDFVRSLQKLGLKSGNAVVHLQTIAYGIDRLQALHDLMTRNLSSLSEEEQTLVSEFLKKFVVPVDVSRRIFETIIIDERSKVQEFSKLTSSNNLEESLVLGAEESSDALYQNEPKSSISSSPDSNQFSININFDSGLKGLHDIIMELNVSEDNMLNKFRELARSIDPNSTITPREQVGKHFNVVAIQSRKKFLDEIYIRLQTVPHAEIKEVKRGTILFRTSKWLDLVEERNHMVQKIIEREKEILNELSEFVLSKVPQIRFASRCSDFLDVTASFGSLAQENSWVRPRFTSSNILNIDNGRHAVVESSLKENSELFVPNDTKLGKDGMLWVISGPNMGGKSTFLRQNALLVIMAQIGSFVPASRASFCIVDRLFTRIGASDDLFSDLSTFMVEMIETSNILKNATSKSLAIVDEIGRGTSGREGLAIAYATLVTLLTSNKCRTLFATHYGTELKALLDKDQISQKDIRFFRTKVIDQKGKLTFEHSLEPGISEKSYAFEIARLAGFSEASLSHAERAFSLLSDGCSLQA